MNILRGPTLIGMCVDMRMGITRRHAHRGCKPRPQAPSKDDGGPPSKDDGGPPSKAVGGHPGTDDGGPADEADGGAASTEGGGPGGPTTFPEIDWPFFVENGCLLFSGRTKVQGLAANPAPAKEASGAWVIAPRARTLHKRRGCTHANVRTRQRANTHLRARAHARDGEHRGVDRIGGWHRKGLAAITI